MNANQLSKALELDYKTTQHHLELLVENNVLMTMGEDYGKMYFLTDAMEQNLDVLDEVARQADLEPAGATADPEDGESADPENGEPADRESTDPEDDHGD